MKSCSLNFYIKIYKLKKEVSNESIIFSHLKFSLKSTIIVRYNIHTNEFLCTNVHKHSSIITVKPTMNLGWFSSLPKSSYAY